MEDFGHYFPSKNISPEDDQSILIETSSCNLQFFSEQLLLKWEFHIVSPQNSLYFSKNIVLFKNK